LFIRPQPGRWEGDDYQKIKLRDSTVFYGFRKVKKRLRKSRFKTKKTGAGIT
jgi:hypothetical protein